MPIIRRPGEPMTLHEIIMVSQRSMSSENRRPADALVRSFLVDVRPSALEARGEPPLCEVGSLESRIPDLYRLWPGKGETPEGRAYAAGLAAGHNWFTASGELPENPESPETAAAWDRGFAHGSGDAEAWYYSDWDVDTPEADALARVLGEVGR